MQYYQFDKVYNLKFAPAKLEKIATGDLIDAINKYLTENGIMTENREDTISFDGYVRKLQKAANEYDFPAIEAIKKDMEELSMSDHQKEKYKMIRQMIEDTDIDDLQIISDIICGGKSEESIKE